VLTEWSTDMASAASRDPTVRRPRIFYGWFVVAAAFGRKTIVCAAGLTFPLFERRRADSISALISVLQSLRRR
jgi:hypothetical protein